MEADYNLVCESGGEKSDERVFWEVYASFTILIFPIGIPVTFMVLLYERRYDLCPKLKHRGTSYIFFRQPDWGDPVEVPEGSKERCAHLLFLVEMYENHCFWFEVVESWRRLMLSSMLILLDDNSDVQTIAAILICLFNIKVFTYYEPYDDYEDDRLAELAQWQLFVILFVVMLMRFGALSSEDDDGSLGLILIAVTILSFIATFVVLLRMYTSESQTTHGKDKNAVENQSKGKIVPILDPARVYKGGNGENGNDLNEDDEDGEDKKGSGGESDHGDEANDVNYGDDDDDDDDVQMLVSRKHLTSQIESAQP
jgi:hypothetical protein